MSDLTAFEGRKLEKLLGMGGGYVLNFSDRTYSDFFIDYRVEIDAAEYRTGGGSKAKRMRTFWAIAPNHTVGRVLEGLISYGIEEQCLGDSNPELIDACRRIAQRLRPRISPNQLNTSMAAFCMKATFCYLTHLFWSDTSLQRPPEDHKIDQSQTKRGPSGPLC